MKNNINKEIIVQNIYSSVGTSKTNIQKITDDLIEIIIDLIYLEKKVNIKNFGAFAVKSKNERVGRNPKTKQIFNILPRNIIKFTLSDKLKSKINS